MGQELTSAIGWTPSANTLENQNRSSFSRYQIPLDILVNIFMYLDLLNGDVPAALRVCKDWNRISESTRFWSFLNRKYILHSYYFHYDENTIPNNVTKSQFKESFRNCQIINAMMGSALNGVQFFIKEDDVTESVEFLQIRKRMSVTYRRVRRWDKDGPEGLLYEESSTEIAPRVSFLSDDKTILFHFEERFHKDAEPADDLLSSNGENATAVDSYGIRSANRVTESAKLSFAPYRVYRVQATLRFRGIDFKIDLDKNSALAKFAIAHRRIDVT